jgi:hypothetical protein
VIIFTIHLFINLSYTRGIHCQWVHIVYVDETANNIYKTTSVISRVLLGKYSTRQLTLQHPDSTTRDKKTRDIKILTCDS